ncbi:MAG TPA: family 20 glycosylhydrolase [Candidatus Limnocylindrales bacterium]
MKQWSATGGSYTLSARSRILVDAETYDTGVTFAADLNVPVEVGGDPQPGDIRLALGADDTRLGEEGYRLTVGAFVQIEARTPAGAFYATRTVLQLLDRSGTVAAGTGCDWPVKPERGLMVDCGRKYFTVGWLRRHIRMLADLKLNHLHLHLSDHLGFRLQSDTHPEVVSAQHYTKKEIAELVALAARYHITVVPEIDMPGHMDPILAAHPGLKLTDAFIDLSNPDAYTLIDELIHEYLPLFPGPYWHLGADEYIDDYGAYPQLLAYARNRYGPNATAKDAYYGFINWANTRVRAAGKTMRMWNDGIKPGDGTIDPDSDIIVEYWDDIGLTPQQLIDRGHQIMNCSWTPTYYVLSPNGARPDVEYLSGSWNPELYQGSAHDSTASTIDDPSRNTGAKLHVWCDDRSAETEDQIADGIRAPLRALAQQTWG